MAGSGIWRRSATFEALRLLQAIRMSPLAGQCSCPSTLKPTVTFAPGQDGCGEQRIGPLVAEKQAQGRLFYALEVLARTRLEALNLDFNHFLPVLPVFVSVVWHALRYWDVEPIGNVESLVLCKQLAPRVPVMPHLTCYRVSQERMDDFLALDFKNVLALRGDNVEPNQKFEFAIDLIKEVKSRLGGK